MNSHDEEGLPPSPAKPLASWYAQGLSDGLGDRLLMFDNSAAPSLELLRFRPDLAQVPGFEPALRDQVHRLGQFRHPGFVPVRSIQRLEPDDDLALISNCTPGKRLSEVLHRTRGPAFAATLIRQLAPALVALQQHDAGISHGVLNPDRIVVSPDGRLTIVEHVVGPAIDTLNLRASQLASIGIALPPGGGSATPRLDVATDWYQLGLVAVSVMLGRQVTASDLPQLETLLDGSGHSPGSDGPGLPPFIRQWLDRALQISSARIESGTDARAALDELVRKERLGDSRRIESLRHEKTAASPSSGASRTDRLTDLTLEVAKASPAVVRSTRESVDDREAGASLIAPSPLAPAPAPPASAPPAPVPPANGQSSTLGVHASEEARQPPQVPGFDAGALMDFRPESELTRPSSPAAIADPQRGAARGDRGAAAVKGATREQGPVAAKTRQVDPGRAAALNSPRPTTWPPLHDLHAATRPRPHDPHAATPPQPRAAERLVFPLWVVAALMLIAAMEAGVIAWLASALSLTPVPAMAVETAASGENVVVSSHSPATPPMRLSVAPDMHWVSVTSPSMAGVLGGSITNAHVGTIRISSPITLKVFEKSRQLGSVPGADLKVPAGRHDIELVNLALGYHLKQSLEVEPGQTVSMHVAPPHGWMTIYAVPAAEVSIDGQPIGRTPLGPLPIALGEHSVTFRHSTGLKDRQRVMVRSGETVRVIGNVRR